MSKSKIDLLRAKAEEAVKTMDSAQQKSGKKPSAKELANLLNELRIYQVELEMQNEELLRAQVELEKTRDQYWQLFNHAPVGYVILDRQGMIIKVNHTFTRMVDEAQENVLGKALARFICDRDQGVFLARFKSFFANPEGKSIELRLRIKNNQELWVLLTATGIQQNQEGNQQILVNIANVTDKKILEDEQKKLEEKVNHLQRLESLGMLAGGIAHDFNNLLTIIRGNAELSMISGAMSPEVKKFQLEIIAATDRASKLTAQMLSYAGEGRIELKTIDISREIEELLPLIRSSISSEHVIKLDLKPGIMVECDLSQVQQVVLNTVVNASEAIVEGNGEISIACYKAKLPAGSEKGFVYLPEERGSHYVCIEIGDNGTGIPENMLAKVCDPFFSTKFTGRGLGMAAALGIIKRHNGALHIESVLQSGTTFRYYLPQNEKVLQKPIDNSPTDKDEEPFQGTALITEDEPIIRRLMENFLQNLGFDVVCVENGLEGVKFLKKNPENLALAIIDMVMPEMNGKDFYMLLRRRFTEVPVVFCSGYSFEFVPEEIRRDPNAAFVQKPFSWKSIEKEIFRLYKR